MKNIVISGLVGALVAAFVFALVPSTVPLGSEAGPDSYSPYNSFNGIYYWYNKQGVKTATTTICSIKSPSATSTLVRAQVYLKTSTTTASQIYFGRSGNTNATTTGLFETDVAAGAQGVVATPAATTTAAGIAAYVFKPSTYLNVTMAGELGGLVTNLAPSGNCQAIFQTAY